MTPEQKQVLKAHLKAIAQILYDESDPEAMKTLEGIELTVRQQIQTHVSRNWRVFYSNGYRNPNRQAKKPEKYLGKPSNHIQASRETGSSAPSPIESSFG